MLVGIRGRRLGGRPSHPVADRAAHQALRVLWVCRLCSRAAHEQRLQRDDDGRDHDDRAAASSQDGEESDWHENLSCTMLT